MKQKKIPIKSHWEQIYRAKSPNEVSWYQAYPTLSLKLIKDTGINKDHGIIDVGGGSSVLVDFLLEAGYSKLVVLDISGDAIGHAKARLGKKANQVDWYEVDITEFKPPKRFELWHDRAVFHFLTERKDRKKYVRTLENATVPDGHIIIATFAIDGPKKCSGLDVVRYDAQSISSELGEDFKLLRTNDETHITPGNVEQRFTYFCFQRQNSK
jgi:SAM-dependent methyltransferase